MSRPAERPLDERPGWAAWVVFAAVLLVMNGVTNAVHGLAAILRDDEFFADGQVVVFDLTAWGWIHIVIGVALFIVGWKLWDGSTWARAAVVALVSMDVVAQFTSIGIYPWWGAFSILFDITILYAVIVHGGELRPTRAALD